MDYMQEDPYSSHRFPGQDPYYSGSGYPSNTSFDRHSEHSIHSDRNRMKQSDIPNGAPYRGSSGNLYSSDHHDDPHGSPPRSLTPPEYRHPSSHGQEELGGGYDPRESPYHNLPPYQGSGNYEEYSEDPGYYGPSSQSPPPAGGPMYHPDLHGGFGQRDGSYAGSRGSFQGPPSGDPHPSYQEGAPRYNGGVHYPEDTYGYQGDPRDDPQYFDQQAPYHDHPSFQDDPRMYPEGDPRMYADQLQEDPRMYPEGDMSHPGPDEDPYNDSYHHQPQQESFHDPRHDSYQGGPPPQHMDPNRPPSVQQQYDPYHDQQDRYSDAPGQRHSLDHPGSQGYPSGNYNDPPPQANDSFQGSQHPTNMYSQDGLLPIRHDPFADDPFREQGSREGEGHLRAEDPYYRGSSPSGGPDPVAYEDRAEPYHERGPPYDDHGPPYHDGGPPYDDHGPPYHEQGPPYDERDGPDPYSQSAPRFHDEGYYPPEEDAARRLEQLNLGAPPMDGHRTPSIDGRSQSMQHTGLPSRFPDLQEVIDFLNSPDDSIKASAAAHLQHICFMDDSVKAKARSLGGLRPLIRLLSHELVEVHKNACGALQNLSFGKSNNDNKREIKNEGGIPELIRLLRKTDQEDVKESVTGVLWNLSSCEDLKQAIIEDGLTVLVNSVILRYSGYSGMGWSTSQMPWTAICRNTTGILRNVSSAGFDARKRLRECRGLVNALIYILKLAAEDDQSYDIDNKVVENTVCILRNLSYRIQEVVDPDFYKKRTLPRQAGKAKGQGKGNNADGPGCFGNKSNKSKSNSSSSQPKSGNQQTSSPAPQLPPSSTEYRALWGPEIHSLYSSVLKRCTNPITMEAAAGAIQNLTACDWQPAVESRAMVRKEKGLPLLVDLLSAESDRVVCATATALRNLAIDDKNKDLVGKYAIRQLVSRLPFDNRNNLPDDTICAVVATLYEVIKDNQSFALALVQEKGLRCLMHINNSQGRYLSRTLKFTLTLLKTMWGYKSLHMEYAKLSYGQPDFTTSKAYPRQEGSRPPDMSRTPSSSNHTTPYNTLSRPMSGQGYDDSTLTPGRAQQHRGAPPPMFDGRLEEYHHRSNASLQDARANDRLNYSRERIPQEDIPLNYMGPGYAPLDEPRPHRTKPPVGGVPLFPNLGPAEPSSPHYGTAEDPHNAPEPLYAQVNKGSRSRRGEPPYGSDGVIIHPGGGSMDQGGADSWV